MLFVVSGCAVGSLITYRIAPDYPRPGEEPERLPGLESAARITFDELGVPHIEANSELDLLRAVGFAHGRDRFFEMDLIRRIARGRISELVGEQPLLSGTTVEFDRAMRGWELESRAREIASSMGADERARLEAYCAGVNAALERNLPLEYRLLRTRPAPWTPEDVWNVGVFNAWTVSHNWEQELTRLLLTLAGGIDRAERIYPAEPPERGRTLPGDGRRRTLPLAIAPELRSFLEELPRTGEKKDSGRSPAVPGSGGSSNAWVVSGARSKSGLPVLASDPHLEHLLPSIAYQVHLKSPGIHVIGAAIPGLPWVVMGHNDTVAWGITSTVADTMDLVVERVDPSRPGRVLHEGGDCALTAREEALAIKDAPPRKVLLRRTCNGPLLNDIYPELLPEGSPLVAVRWYASGVEQSLAAMAQVNRARSVSELHEAALAMTSPIQTFTAADVEGHIGSFVSGTVPVRTAHRGTFPVPGWSARYRWEQEADPRALAWGMDSKRGFYAHANNLMVDPRETEFPIHLDAGPWFRFERIVQRLDAVPKHDVASFAAMQTDVKSLRAERLVPILVGDLEGAPLRDDRDREALELLRRWDFDAPPSSAAATIFFTTYREAVLAAMEDELRPAARRFFMSERYSNNVTDAWFEHLHNPVWDRLDTREVEDRRTVVRAAFFRAVDALAAKFGNRPMTWRWGRLHSFQPVHAFGDRVFLGGLMNLPASEAGGELESIWKAHFEMGHEHDPFKVMAGPVYRMVVDLADIAHARWVIDTGSSGWPGSPHYGDQYRLWRDGKLAPMRFDWDEIRAHATGAIVLSPGK